MIALQFVPLGWAWFVGARPARGDFGRAVVWFELYLAIPLFAALTALGVLVRRRGVPAALPRYLVLAGTCATLLTFVLFSVALIFVLQPVD